MSDLRPIWRQLRTRPGSISLAILTVAICVVANLALFCVIHAILSRNLPFPTPEALVKIFNTYPKAGIEHK